MVTRTGWCLATLTMVVGFVLAVFALPMPTAGPLPPLPATMPSVLGPVPVERVDSIPGDPDALADVRFMARRVRIRRDLSLAGSWQAYFHESCHLWLYDDHASLGGDEEERTCDVWANARFQEMATRR